MNDPSIPAAAPKDSLADDAFHLAGEGLRRASPLSISMAIIVLSLIGSLGVFLYFNKETIVRLFEIGSDVKALQNAHDHCHAELAAIKQEVTQLRTEVQELRIRVAANR